MKRWKSVLRGVGLVVAAAATLALLLIGPRNIIGALRYDEHHEGRLKVGDRAPDAELLSLDGKAHVRVSESIGGKPLVLILGSFT